MLKGERAEMAAWATGAAIDASPSVLWLRLATAL